MNILIVRGGIIVTLIAFATQVSLSVYGIPSPIVLDTPWLKCSAPMALAIFGFAITLLGINPGILDRLPFLGPKPPQAGPQDPPK